MCRVQRLAICMVLLINDIMDTKTDDEIGVDKSLPVVIATSGSNAGFSGTEDTRQRVLGNSQPGWLGGTNQYIYLERSFALLFMGNPTGLERL